MKKTVAALLAAAFALLTACTGGSAPEATPHTTPAPPEAAAWPPGTSDSVQTVLSLPLTVTSGNMGADYFAVENGLVYLRSGWQVSVYEEGELVRTLDFSGDFNHIWGMDVDNGTVYVYDCDRAVAEAPDGSRRTIKMGVEALDGAIDELRVEDGIIYATVFCDGFYGFGGRTWIIDTAADDPMGSADWVPGYAIDGGIVYTVLTNGMYPQYAILNVLYPDGSIESVRLHSEYGFGNVYLLRCGGGQYDLQVQEFVEDENYVLTTHTAVWRVDSGGEPLYVLETEDDTDIYYNVTPCFQGGIYAMRKSVTRLDIVRMPDVYTSEWADYVSPLAELIPTAQ